MTHQHIDLDIQQNPESSLGDVVVWAEQVGEPYATICELRKVPARLGMIDDDIGLIPADIAYFEEHIAASGYAVVSKARDLKSARLRGNARVRALLKRFRASMEPDLERHHDWADWDELIAFVRVHEGFKERGARFTTGTSRGLMMLRARFHVGPGTVAADDVNRVAAELSSEKRKSFGRALRTLNRLIEESRSTPEISALLPSAPLAMPGPVSARERISWQSLPEPFRQDAEAAMQSALARPEDRLAAARAAIAAGEDAERVLRELDAEAAGRRRVLLNRKAAIAGWRTAITWLVLAAERHGLQRDQLEDLEELFTNEIIETACTDQIARSKASKHLKDPDKTQTLTSRLAALETLSRHGLKLAPLVAIVQLQRRFHVQYVRAAGKSMTDDAKRLCDVLIRRPQIAAAFVNAPGTIARRATEGIETGRSEKNLTQELSGLRLYAAAVLFAVQVSRPLRTSNLIRLRYRSTREAPGHITWVRKRTHAELRFFPGEIKNDREVTVHLLGDEAKILWTWLHDFRPRYLELRGLSDTPYVIPGEAHPRLVKSGMALPQGCLAPSTIAEIWRDGADIIGIDMTPHQSRHAVATLILAIEPGNFAKAAAVLGDTEETVRRHYGRDSGAEAAKQVRAALKSQHPGIFAKMKRRVS